MQRRDGAGEPGERDDELDAVDADGELGRGVGSERQRLERLQGRVSGGLDGAGELREWHGDDVDELHVQRAGGWRDLLVPGLRG
jgi:hypothetical protein